MRKFTTSVIGAAALLIPAAVVAGGAGSGTINYRATATYSDGTSADRLYSVNVGDLDGDGAQDEGWLRVACADGAVTAAFVHSVKSPRDSASGQASGRRMHKPFKFTAELDRTAGPVGKTVGWDIKKVEGSGAKSAVKPTYNIKENKGARVEHSGASDASAGKGADGKGGDAKIMAQDDWHQVAVREGAPNLCE
jgi:hypothetical protein